MAFIQSHFVLLSLSLLFAQHNSFVSAQVNPPITYSFPDCANGPLKTNAICDTSKDPLTRAKALVNAMTVDEMVNNTDNFSGGAPRLGLPPYQWWSEALHGVASSPGVTFAPSGEFSYATSFPQPILMGAAFDDDLIKAVATVISTEARAFNNAGRAGLDFFTPNINPFKDPRWGRGQETPGEDPFHTSAYVFQLIQGLQGGLDPKPYFKIVADCKHFAAYDMENWHGNVRYGFNAIVSQQDLSEYYLPSFQKCVRDAKVGSVMCSYNAVNGFPSCASPFLLQTVLRDHWGFTEDRWVTSDCDAVGNVFDPHNFTSTLAGAAAVSLNAGTDVDCGLTYGQNLGAALSQNLTTVDKLKTALTRQFASLVRLGYFDPASKQPYRQLGWKDVNLPSSQQLAHKAALKGLVLLKNTGILPLSKSIKKLALIGPWANATTEMQGNYQGVAPFLISPMMAAQQAGFEVTFVEGTNASTTNTSGFPAAVEAAKGADAVIFAGGLWETIEREEVDRETITWPGNQLDLVRELEATGKPLVVLQFGGGQVDDSELVKSKSVGAILWAGYPGQSGGTAIFDVLTGKASPAGRLTTTQYPADYVNQVPMTDMSLRPSSSNPGRTYKWFTGTPVFPFGFGMHFTTFSHSFARKPSSSYSIQSLVAKSKNVQHADLATFDTFSISTKNTGKATSDYVALLFVNSNAGPAPHPNKELVGYTRLHDIAPGRSATASIAVTLGAISRTDENGDQWLYPGTYTLSLDTDALKTTFKLTGRATRIMTFPRDTTTPPSPK
ncbi:beta-xylosidase [Panus rudis PR-1116 ss-1]|nr:beta-xylosidase [Panus rudis PR-1116 ss-1]